MSIKDKLLSEIDELLLAYCDSESIEKESQEWYLRNYLVDLIKAINEGTKIEVERSSKLLVRFCVDTMKWESDLYRQASSISSVGMKLSKTM